MTLAVLEFIQKILGDERAQVFERAKSCLVTGDFGAAREWVNTLETLHKAQMEVKEEWNRIANGEK